MKHLQSIAKNLSNNIIGIYTNNNNIFSNNKILFCTKKPIITLGINAFIVPKGMTFETNIPILEIEESVPFENGDIVSISSNGFINVVWEINSPHNGLYVTDLCNSKCIICPQLENTSSRYNECLQILDLINLNKYKNIGITGGEPTLDIDKLIEIIEKIAKKSPNKAVHILTNGRKFSQKIIVEKLASIKNIHLSYGIPLYSDIAEEHDYIVGVNGAFNETIQGIYNLGKFNQDIEIRTVILKQNYKKLKNIAEYIYRNIPFINHVALMGMEYHGNAEINYNLVAIDPIDYKNELFEAIRNYVRYGINIDIFNIPLCLVDYRIQKYCCDSISTWKKTFLPQCEGCIVQNSCSGVFETSFKHSDYIKAILK